MLTVLLEQLEGLFRFLFSVDTCSRAWPLVNNPAIEIDVYDLLHIHLSEID